MDAVRHQTGKVASNGVRSLHSRYGTSKTCVRLRREDTDVPLMTSEQNLDVDFPHRCILAVRRRSSKTNAVCD